MLSANSEAAATFLAHYRALYTQHRHGAYYHGQPSRDWQRVCELLQTWTPERLEQLATVFLLTDDPWISRSGRTIAVFASRASWCDDRLCQEEAKRGRGPEGV